MPWRTYLLRGLTAALIAGGIALIALGDAAAFGWAMVIAGLAGATHALSGWLDGDLRDNIRRGARAHER